MISLAMRWIAFPIFVLLVTVNAEYGNVRGVITESSRALVEDAFDLGGLDCSISTPDNSSSPRKIYPVEFWYGVEATTNGTAWLPVLEGKIYQIALERMSWCTGEEVNGRRAMAVMENDAVNYARELGIISVTPAPADKIRPDIECSHDLLNETDACNVVQGMLNIQAREADDLAHTLDAIQSAIETAMVNDVLLGDDIPRVIKVTYLGTSENDVAGVVMIPPLVKTIVTDDDESNNTPMIIAISSASLLLLLLLLLGWKKRRTMTEREFAALGDDDGFQSLPGTGDPVGAFHYGMFHYFPDGEKYLSTNCRDCHETRLAGKSDFGGIPAPVSSIEELEDDEEDSNYHTLIMANSKDLGGVHSGMDVHNCKSSTCKICRPTGGEVSFSRIEHQNSMLSVISENSVDL